MFEKLKKSPRQISESISSGKTKETHLGEKSQEVLLQEFYSLMNTKEAFRDSNWRTKWNAVRDLMKEKEIWDGYEQKYKLAFKGFPV